MYEASAHVPFVGLLITGLPSDPAVASAEFSEGVITVRGDDCVGELEVIVEALFEGACRFVERLHTTNGLDGANRLGWGRRGPMYEASAHVPFVGLLITGVPSNPAVASAEFGEGAITVGGDDCVGELEVIVEALFEGACRFVERLHTMNGLDGANRLGWGRRGPAFGTTGDTSLVEGAYRFVDKLETTNGFEVTIG
ncbi:hypothetical protein EV363DRAFT_1448247 [Boletus edulis]|nr:hypothetical protein EV363DRAFT_1448247 [Boletus edulis]